MTDQTLCVHCQQPIRVYEGDYGTGRYAGDMIHEGRKFRCQVDLLGRPKFATAPSEIEMTAEDDARTIELLGAMDGEIRRLKSDGMRQVGRHGSASAVLTQAAEYEAEIARKQMDRTILNPAPNAAAQRIIAEADAPHDPPSNILRGLKYGLIGSAFFWALVAMIWFVVWLAVKR